MSKQKKWEGGYPIDFELIGIVSTMKEYKLGWHLNQMEIFHLVKTDDIRIEFAEQKIIRISNLADETEYRVVHLLRNKLVGSGSTSFKYLLPELQQFDYLIKLRNTIEENWSVKVMDVLRQCAAIDYAMVIDLEKVKAKENLIF
jgi:hypothetical protein